MDGDEDVVSTCPNCGWRQEGIRRFSCPECGGPAKVVRQTEPGHGVRPIANGYFMDRGTTQPPAPPVPDPRVRRPGRPSDQRPI
jgi:ssDNA-binding Zn-finger/Zn-ribbon topoisomerase 1